MENENTPNPVVEKAPEPTVQASSEETKTPEPVAQAPSEDKKEPAEESK